MTPSRKEEKSPSSLALPEGDGLPKEFECDRKAGLVKAGMLRVLWRKEGEEGSAEADMVPGRERGGEGGMGGEDDDRRSVREGSERGARYAMVAGGGRGWQGLGGGRG